MSSYHSMMKERHGCNHNVVQTICTQTGRKYNRVYNQRWFVLQNNIPVDVLRYVQNEVFDWVLDQHHISTTVEQRDKLRNSLALPDNNS